jgi:hypothetical protein
VARHVLCVAAAWPRPAVDWRAVLESRAGTSVADDKAGELRTGDTGKRAPPSAAALLDVPRPYPGSQDPDKDLIPGRFRHPQLAGPHRLGAAEMLYQDGLHRRRLRSVLIENMRTPFSFS